MTGSELVVVGTDVDTWNLSVEFAVGCTWVVSEVAGNHYEKNVVAGAGGMGSLAESGALVGVPEHEVGRSTAGPSDGRYTQHAVVGKGRGIAETLRAPAWEFESATPPLDGPVRTKLWAGM